ncbi:MAG: 50S ribosomal protein L1 [Desulfurococcales archaeon ex4484_42]|nr:MAG: 50S ribosomal protein L1 [Desulfurococcales archaeon ex4484_42]
MPLTKKAIVNAIKKAIELGKGRRFKQSVELIVVFKGFDPKSPEIKFRDAIVLPKGLGKTPKILVVANGDMLLKAKELGVNTLSDAELKSLSKREAKKLARKYEWVLVKADLMAIAGRILGPALGPRGKFPIPVPLNADIGAIVKRYMLSTRLRNKEQPWVACKVGTEDMNPEDIAENIMTVLEHIKSKIKRPLEAATKIYVKTTMGPPVEVMM